MSFNLSFRNFLVGITIVLVSYSPVGSTDSHSFERVTQYGTRVFDFINGQICTSRLCQANFEQRLTVCEFMQRACEGASVATGIAASVACAPSGAAGPAIAACLVAVQLAQRELLRLCRVAGANCYQRAAQGRFCSTFCISNRSIGIVL